MKSKVLTLSLVVLSGLLFLGGVEAQAPKATDPIIVSYLSDLGHGSAKDGVEAAKMAVEEINKKGVLVGGVRRPISLIPVDVRDMSPGVPVSDTILTYQKVLLEKKPVANIGGAARSESAMALLDVLSEYKTIELGCFTMSPAVGKKILDNYDKYKYRFQLNWNAIHLAKYITQQFEYLRKTHNLKKAFLVYEDTMWARATTEGVKKAAESMGWEIVGVQATPLGATDFSGVLSQVRRAGAQVVSVAYSNPESAVLAKQMYDLRIPALLIGYNSFLINGGTWGILGGKNEWDVVAVGGISLVGLKSYPKSVEFERKLRTRLGRYFEGIHGVGASYDAVYILAAAIERVNSLEPDKLIPALEATSYEGVNGRVRFGKDHFAVYGDDPKKESVAVSIQWKKPGIRVPVLPSQIAEGPIDLPSWMKVK